VGAWLLHDLARAEALLASSLALFRELQFIGGIAEVLASVGRVARAQGRLAHARSAWVESLTLALPSGPYHLVPGTLEELAGLAVLQGRAEPAARLYGAAQALRSAKHMVPMATHRACHDRDRATARDALGDAAFEAACRAGQAMELEDIASLALEASDGTAPAR
jgi:hypothetical protein